MKVKLMIVSLSIPYPLVHGGAIAQYFFLKNLEEIYDIFFCSLVWSDEGKKQMAGLQQALPLVKVISIAPAREEPKLSAAYKTIRSFYRAGKKLIAPGPAKAGVAPADTDDLKYYQAPVIMFPPFFIDKINEVINRENIKIIQFDFYEALSLLKAVPKNIKKIFIHHEIRSKRLEMSTVHTSQSAEYKNYLTECFKIVENNFLLSADVVVVFNEQDRDMLSAFHSNVRISPFGIPQELIARSKADSRYDRLLFIGGQAHFPNLEGLRWFLEKIVVPYNNDLKLPVYIIGKWNDGFIETYKNFPAIHFLGEVADVDKYLERSVLVAPIFSGSGLRTKILYAFANNVPVLSTPFAAEGLFSADQPNPHISLFQDELDFISKSKQLFADQELLTEMAGQARIFFVEHFSEKELVAKRMAILNDACTQS